MRYTVKVCLVTSKFPRTSSKVRGGVETYIEVLAQVLLDSGIEVHVLTYGNEQETGEEPSLPVLLHHVEVRWIPYFSSCFPGLFEAWQVYRVLRSLDAAENFDIIEGSNDEGIMVFVAGAFKQRFWMRFHSSLLQHIINKRQKLTWKRKFSVWLDRLAARRSVNLVTHSSAHRVEMALEYQLDCSRIAIVPHAVKEPPASEVVSSSFDSPMVAYIGTMDRRKGIDLFLDAVPQVLKGSPEARFVIVGRDGKDSDCSSWSEWFQEKYPELAIGTKVTFLGPISDEELGRLWPKITLVVVPSRYESFGLVVVEAFARCKPVVVTDGGALPEVASSSAVVVSQSSSSLAGGVCQILQDPHLASKLSARGRRTFENNYSLKRMQEHVLSLYGIPQ